MSKLPLAIHWICDRCRHDGGPVDARETVPHQWLSLVVLVGTPQIAAEQCRENKIHLCQGCAHTLLYAPASAGDPPEEMLRLRALFSRPRERVLEIPP